MTNDYKFFHEFFDGQITKPESDKFKMFKVMLFSLSLTIGVFCLIMGYSKIVPLFVLAFGMMWNFYAGLKNNISSLFSILVAFLYFYVACEYSLYSNCLIYVAFYIPFQQIANTKDYSEGDFVQIRKFISESNKILLFIFFLALTVCLTLMNFAVGASFVYLDAISAALLVCSAILRNERYSEYYIFRFLALIASIALWVMVGLEFGFSGTILIIVMYASYMIFDLVSMIYQRKTYINEYMQKQIEVKEIQKKKKVKEKTEIYEKMKQSK